MIGRGLAFSLHLFSVMYGRAFCICITVPFNSDHLTSQKRALAVSSQYLSHFKVSPVSRVLTSQGNVKRGTIQLSHQSNLGGPRHDTHFNAVWRSQEFFSSSSSYIHLRHHNNEKDHCMPWLLHHLARSRQSLAIYNPIACSFISYECYGFAYVRTYQYHVE